MDIVNVLVHLFQVLMWYLLVYKLARKGMKNVKPSSLVCLQNNGLA
jgi:hypothetical protein